MTDIPDLRRDLREKYGARNYRITKGGTVLARRPGCSWRIVGQVIDKTVHYTGKQPELDHAKRFSVYLDALTVSKASELGAGNISLGLRRAIEIATL